MGVACSDTFGVACCDNDAAKRPHSINSPVWWSDETLITFGAIPVHDRNDGYERIALDREIAYGNRASQLAAYAELAR